MTLNETSRRELIEDKVEQVRDGPHQEHKLPWRGEQRHFPVVRLPVDVVLLNPNSHRIKAQLLSHPDRELVESDPFSDEAQRVIEELLRATGQFEELKQNLAEVGQQEPGVVTAGGVLVNANRRTVALRDLPGESYVDVAVLEANASPQEIADLELDLQMRKEFREEYTFTNRILFIHELVDRGLTDEEIALRLNLAASSEDKELKKGREQVQRELRMLGMIRELQDVAQSGGHRVPMTFFDDKRQSLIEIDKAYEKLKEKEPAKAEFVKKTRMVALLTEAGYKEVREINEDFLEAYLLPALDYVADHDGFRGDLRPLLTPNEPDEADEELGTDLLVDEEVEAAATDRADPERLLELLARAQDEETVDVPGRGGDEPVTVTPEELLDHLTTAIEDAADEHKSDRRLDNRLVGPMKKADKARKEVNRIPKKLKRVHDRPDFDWETFEEHLQKLRRAYEAMLKQVTRYHPSTDGTETRTLMLSEGDDEGDG